MEKVFHVCHASHARDSFLCPNGTIFNQEIRVCDWWNHVDCPKAADYFFLNAESYSGGKESSPSATN